MHWRTAFICLAYYYGKTEDYQNAYFYRRLAFLRGDEPSNFWASEYSNQLLADKLMALETRIKEKIGDNGMFKKGYFYQPSLLIMAILLSTTNVNATQYICDGWEYDDGSRSTEAVKFEIEENTVKVDGFPYVIAGNSLDLYKNVEEIFLALDRKTMDGSVPLRTYHFILDPCRGGGDDYSYKMEQKFSSCKGHELVRIGSRASIFWNLGMQKTSCKLF